MVLIVLTISEPRLAAVDWRINAMWVCLTAALLVATFIYPMMVLRRYVRIMINLMDDHAPAAENGGSENGRGSQSLHITNGDPFPPGQTVRFRAADGHALEGVILPAQSSAPPKGMIVFAHEVGSHRGSCRRYCRCLLDNGYDVFAFDFRGHGASPPQENYRPRQWPSDREKADVLGAIAFIGSYLEKQGRPRSVGLFGVSRGGGAAILASVGLLEVQAIVTDGAFSSDLAMEYLMRRFATIFARIRVVAENHPPMFWRFLRWVLFRECARRFQCRFPSVRKAIRKLGSRPILLIHGEKDSYIPVAHAQHLYELATGPKDLWLVPQARHNQCIRVAPTAYAQRVLHFFDEYLSPPHHTRPDALPLVQSPQPGLVRAGMPQLAAVYKNNEG